MTITLYSFIKRENSTARPSAGTSFDGQIRFDCTIVSPSVVFSAQNLSGYNYAYIPAFSRWYFIRNWSFSDGLWIAEMECDTLATYRDQIGASEQYIIRSSAEYDTYITDTYYPAKTDKTVITEESYQQPWYPKVNSDSYVVGIVGDNTKNGTGAVSYFWMTPGQFKALGNQIMGDISYMGDNFGTDITLDFLKTQINPFQYVVSCKRYPFSPTGELTGQINLGWWPISAVAVKIEGTKTVRGVFTCDVPKHPKQARGKYLNAGPFARYTLYIPCFGQIPLPADIMANIDVLYVYADVDIITGEAILRVCTTGGPADTIYKSSAMVGADVQLGQISQNNIGAVGGAIGAIGSAFSLNMAGYAGSLASATEAMTPQLQTAGTNGSFADFYNRAQLVGEFFDVADDDNANHGKPLCKVRTIRTIPGFVMCEKPDIAITGTAEEARTIKSYMEGGFFFE